MVKKLVITSEILTKYLIIFIILFPYYIPLCVPCRVPMFYILYNNLVVLSKVQFNRPSMKLKIAREKNVVGKINICNYVSYRFVSIENKTKTHFVDEKYFWYKIFGFSQLFLGNLEEFC